MTEGSTRPANLTPLLVLATCTVLLVSRITLVLHEFIGHGAVAKLFGARLTGHYLFLFAGGRVSYQLPNTALGPRLVIALGGIVLEILLGALLFLVALRIRSGVARFVLTCFATIDVGHAAIYLARGTHFGYGDGALLSRVVGPGTRAAVVFGASALAIAVAAFGGASLGRRIARWVRGRVARVVAIAFLVFTFGALVHGVLAWTEITWFPDPAYVAIMEHESMARARASLERRLAEQARRGERLPTAEEQRRILEALERAQRPWPLDLVLFPAILVALGRGFVRGGRRGLSEAADAVEPLGWRPVAVVAGALGVCLGIVFVIQRVGH